MALVGQNFTMYRGETKQINMSITDASGNPADLTSGSLTWIMSYNSNSDILITKILNSGITLISGTGGLFRINFASGDTVLYQGDYYHQTEFVTAGEDRTILAIGYMTIYPGPQ